MKEDMPTKSDVIIIDPTIMSNVKLVPDMLLRGENKPAIAIINQKREDFFDIQSEESTDATDDAIGQ